MPSAKINTKEIHEHAGDMHSPSSGPLARLLIIECNLHLIEVISRETESC